MSLLGDIKALFKEGGIEKARKEAKADRKAVEGKEKKRLRRPRPRKTLAST